MRPEVPNRDLSSIRSSSIEKFIEHVFLANLLRCLWRMGEEDIVVLSPEVDQGGTISYSI